MDRGSGRNRLAGCWLVHHECVFHSNHCRNCWLRRYHSIKSIWTHVLHFSYVVRGLRLYLCLWCARLHHF